ncbi:Receptor-like protein EIX2 [Glycine soja]
MSTENILGLVTSIDLSSNKLLGEIPREITDLNGLHFLNLSHNQLIGPIPEGTQLQTFDASSFIGNNLCGPPLPINCSSNGKTHSYEGSAWAWSELVFCSVRSIGFILGFWIVIAPLLICRSWRCVSSQIVQMLVDKWVRSKAQRMFSGASSSKSAQSTTPYGTSPFTVSIRKQIAPLNCTAYNLTGTCPTNLQDHQNSPATTTCPDYFRWIHEDLRPWARTGITQDMVERAKQTANFRLIILKGRAYLETYSRPYQTRDVFSIWGILQLLRRYPGKIPDLELMFDCEDWPVVLADRYNGPNVEQPPPLFRYCGNDATLDIVFPDWSFWGWAEINIKPWHILLGELKEGTTRIPWLNREPYAYWKVEVTEEGVRKVVSDAVHKREDDPERRMEHQRILGKVTESEEVKRRLGGESVVTEEKVPRDQSATLILNLWFAWAEDSSMNYEAGRAEVEQVNQGAAGERRQQESSN